MPENPNPATNTRSKKSDFSIKGLNHLGMVVRDIDQAKIWFVDTLGFKVIEDRGDLIFLLIGNDILALKTRKRAVNKPEHGGEPSCPENDFSGWQHLDHYGFYAEDPQEVDAFHQFLKANKIEVLKGPYDRSDGRSVYFRDPCGLVGEYLYFKPPSNC